MRKLLILILFAFITNFGISQSFRLYLEMPSSLDTGKIYSVKVILLKYDFTQYGEFQLNLSEGFVIMESDAKADLKKITDNKMKLLWAQLPLQDTLTFNLKIYVRPKNQKDLQINYWFEYQANNQRGLVKGDVLSFKNQNGKLLLTENQQIKKQQNTNSSVFEEVYNFFDK